MEGKPLPEFTIQLLDSVSYLHSKDIPEGKKLIVFYYSPTCPYCRAQMRDMINNMEKFKDEQLYILTDANLSSIKYFVNYFDLGKYQNVTIGRDTGIVIPRKYELMSVPFTACFDKNKNLKVAYSGRTNSNSLLDIR
jgi:thiol-disulfide isomerase/thioredoxin